MHFFNPVPVMSLVEVIRAPETSDATAEPPSSSWRASWARRRPRRTTSRASSRTASSCRTSTRPCYALQDGVAEAEAIDTIAKLGFNHPDRTARARRPDRARHVRLDHGGAARGARRRQVRAVRAAPRARRGGHLGRKSGRGSTHTHDLGRVTVAGRARRARGGAGPSRAGARERPSPGSRCARRAR